MNRLMLITAAALVALSADAMSLAEARDKTAAIIENPSEMTKVMQQLSPADQKAFVGEMNAAIAKMPEGSAKKNATAVNVNAAALKGSAKGNAADLVAEVFATAPVEALPAINEAFAKDVFNRAPAGGQAYSDEQFADAAKKVMKSVNDRVAGSDDAGVRGAFAAVMLVRASNGSPASLASDLADTLGDSADAAKNEWFPAALGAKADYDPMMAAAGVQNPAAPELAIMIAGPQRHDLIVSLIAGGEDGAAALNDGFGNWSQVQNVDNGIYTVPRTTNPNAPWNPELPRGYAAQTVR